MRNPSGFCGMSTVSKSNFAFTVAASRLSATTKIRSLLLFLYRTFIDYPSPVSLAHYASGPTPLALIHVDVYRTAPYWHGGRRMRPKREQRALAGGRRAGRTAAPRNSGETHCPTAR